jgi:IMP dehydrogenase/GMP reductase
MKLYKDSEQLCFDDILLVPQNSDVSSRKDVKLNTVIGMGSRGIGLGVPVIAAPMDTVCEYELAVATRKNGGIGIIHRYNTLEERIRQVKIVKAHDRAICGVAVGATGDFLSEAWQLAYAGASVILIDTANGHSEYAIEAVKKIRRTLSNSIHIMAEMFPHMKGLQDCRMQVQILFVWELVVDQYALPELFLVMACLH